jgi:hypothetical protein
MMLQVLEGIEASEASYAGAPARSGSLIAGGLLPWKVNELLPAGSLTLHR